MNAPHPREDEAAAYVFGSMDAAQRLHFIQAMEQDPLLRELVAELEDTAALLALDAPQHAAPVRLRDAVLASVREIPQQPRAQRASTVVIAPPTNRAAHLGWGAAACLAAIAGVQWLTLQKLEISAAQSQRSLAELSKRAEAAQRSANEASKQLAQAQVTGLKLRDELARMTETHDGAKTQIAMLQATLAEYKQGVAVVVWNSERQEGILKLEKMPPVETGKDYQLWVVDPSKKTPVNAGVVTVDPQGFAKVDFKPTLDIEKAEKFALSVEQKGGVTENKGPIVLLSE